MKTKPKQDQDHILRDIVQAYVAIPIEPGNTHEDWFT